MAAGVAGEGGLPLQEHSPGCRTSVQANEGLTLNDHARGGVSRRDGGGSRCGACRKRERGDDEQGGDNAVGAEHGDDSKGVRGQDARNTGSRGALLTAPSDGEADDVLMAQARAGDPHAFAMLFERHRGSVLRQCRSRLRDQALAEEAVQETFTRLLAALPRFEDRGQLPNYLSRVARFVCLDLLAEREQHLVGLGEAPESRDPVDVEHVCERKHSAEMVLRGLSQRDAALLRAKHFDDRPTPEIACQFGLTAGSAAVLLTRARTSARRFAHRQGLHHGLWPAPAVGALLRRLLPSHAGSTARLAAAPLAGLLILGSLLAPDLSEIGRSPEAAVEYRDTGAQPWHVSSADAAPRGGAGHDGAPGRLVPQADLPVATAVPAAVRPVRRSLVPLPAEVTVPGLGRRVHQQAPPDPDVEYGVLIESGPSEVQAAVEAKDEPAAEPVHSAGCALAARSPVTYCKRQ